MRGLDPKLADFRAPTPLFPRPLTRQIMVVDSVPNLGAVEHGFVIVAVVIAVGLVLATRARRRDRRDRDELRAHVRRLGGPFDPDMLFVSYAHVPGVVAEFGFPRRSSHQPRATSGH